MIIRDYVYDTSHVFHNISHNVARDYFMLRVITY